MGRRLVKPVNPVTPAEIAAAQMRILAATLSLQKSMLQQQIRDQICPAPNPLNRAA